MLNVPIQSVPNQEFTVNLNNNAFLIQIKTCNGITAVSISINGTDIIDGMRAVAGAPLIPYQYLESGNLMFLTNNYDLPIYTEFNVTQGLVYFTAAELASFRTPVGYPITAADFNPLGGASVEILSGWISLMANAFDDRLVNLQILIAGQTVEYNQDYSIIASGTRYASGTMGEGAIRIDNISKTDRDFIISKTTLWNPTHSPVGVVLSVGRESYGTFEIFRGGVILSQVGQPPDISLTMTCAVGAATIGYGQSFSMPPNSSLQSIAQEVANNLTAAGQPATLDFQSTQGAKLVSNFSYSGPVLNQVNKISQLAPVVAYIENGKLVVRDIGTATNTATFTLSKDTGMIGVPEITDKGIRVKCLIQNNLFLGAPVQVSSTVNPLANGLFYIYKLGFEVASRENPFYWVLELTPQNLAFGYTQ